MTNSNELFISLPRRGNLLDGAALDLLVDSLSGLAHLRFLNIEYGYIAQRSVASSSGQDDISFNPQRIHFLQRSRS